MKKVQLSSMYGKFVDKVNNICETCFFCNFCKTIDLPYCNGDDYAIEVLKEKQRD